MMVTFVSQCEKNALKKTRRVLDAFANRIGDNTWQTIITEEGLQAVKKLLRKTASKSTAVSCHWIRSRSRSQFLWVVGNKGKFNFEGVVPVNTTEKEVFMDMKQAKPVKGMLYANTHLQPLEQHLFAVGFVAEQLYRYFYPDKNNQANAAFVAGCFHDIGKLDPAFQKWVINPKNKNYQADDGQHIDDAKFSFEKHPRHNEISALIFQCLSDRASSIKSIKLSVKHAIYWHHAKPFRPKAKDDFDTYGKIFTKLVGKNDRDKVISLLSEQPLAMLEKVSGLDRTYRGQENSFLTKSYIPEFDDETLVNYEKTPFPYYKEYDSYERIEDYQSKVTVNAINNEIRACLITADRWVSSLSASDLAQTIEHKKLDDFISEQLERYVTIESDLKTQIEECLTHFPNDERSQQQFRVAQKLADDTDHVKVLAGAAGCGKTKIALEWAGLTNAQQIIWVCPRVQICQGMFTELKASENPYFQNATVEIFTGEFKFTDSFDNPTPEDKQLTADIVITTIDQLLGSVISHTKADRLLNYLSAHIVFDEYHEYITMPAFNLLFAELLASRKELKNGCHALLVSATPHYFYLKNILNLDIDYDVVEMESFNISKYQVDFVVYDESKEDETNPLYQRHDQTTFVISNTATTAQKSFIANLQEENAILLHSKYKKSDKKALFNRVFDSFKRDGNPLFDLLRSGPIVQASLNITCDYMVSEITTAENCLQRMGRLDRFGLNEAVNIYTIAIPESMKDKKRTGAVARFLSSSHTLQSTQAWYEFLLEQLDNCEKEVSIKELYTLYKDFYEAYPTAQSAISEDMIACLKESVGIIASKISEPRTMPKIKNKEQKRTKISASSLRGNSCFVQMAVCDLTDNSQPLFVNKYAYEINSSENIEIDNLTESLETINNSGILDYVAQKHGRIDAAHPVKGVPANKIQIRKDVLKSAARDPEYPIYLSYTEIDMVEHLGEVSPYGEAMFYVVTNKQPVGTLALKHCVKN